MNSNTNRNYGAMPAHNWITWIEKNILFCSAALLLAGVICFFAFNWQGLNKFIKLAVPFSAFLALGFFAAFKGLETFAGKMLSFCAAFTVGIFFAVYGQVYQTGADAWQLFLSWALVIIPLAVLTKETALWLLFVIISNVFFYTFPIKAYFGYNALLLIPALFNFIVYAVFEVIDVKFKISRPAYFKNILLIVVLAALSLAANIYIWNAKFAFSAAFAPFFIFGSFIYYFTRKTNFTFVGLLFLSAAIFLINIFSYILIMKLEATISVYFIMPVISIIIFGAASVGLYQIHKYFNRGKTKKPERAKESQERPEPAQETDLAKQKQKTSERQIPVIIKAVSGTGAWFIALFIIALVSMAIGSTSSRSSLAWIVWGLVLAAAAFILKYLKTSNKPVLHLFLNQISLAFMLAGKTAFCFGMVNSGKHDNGLENSLFTTLLIVSTVTYPFYNSAIDRFIGVLATMGTAYFCNNLFLWQAASPDVVYALTFFVALFIFYNRKKNFYPMAYAFIIAGATTFIKLFPDHGYKVVQQNYLQILAHWPKLLFIAAIIYFAWLYFKQHSTLNKHKIIGLITGAILLVLFNTASVIGAGLAFAGKYTEDKLLLIFGYIVFLSGLSFFYYNLNTSLMTKSIILIVSGLAALGAALLLKKADKTYAK